MSQKCARGNFGHPHLNYLQAWEFSSPAKLSFCPIVVWHAHHLRRQLWANWRGYTSLPSPKVKTGSQMRTEAFKNQLARGERQRYGPWKGPEGYLSGNPQKDGVAPPTSKNVNQMGNCGLKIVCWGFKMSAWESQYQRIGALHFLHSATNVVACLKWTKSSKLRWYVYYGRKLNR